MSRRFLWSVAVCLLPALVHAEDFAAGRLDNWHQWRRPDATGTAPKGDPPITWDEKTNIKWKTPIPGKGSSTPIVWGDQVFVVTAVDTGRAADAKDIPAPDPKFAKDKKTTAPTTYHQWIVMCLDRTTGKVRWQQVATERVPHEGHHESHSYAAYSPATDGKFLYVALGSFGVYCYDLSGKLIWKQNLGRMETRYGWGEGGSPALAGNTLVVNFDHEGKSFIVALDAATGDTKWKVPREEPSSWSTPVIVPQQDRTQVIVSATNKVRSYDLATGRVLWECGGQTINVIPSPVISDGLAICMSGYRGSAAFAIPLNSGGDVTGKTTWQHGNGTPYVPSPMLMGGRLYFTSLNVAQLSCLDAKTGKVIFDRERLPGLTSLYASPVGAAGRIYIVGRDGTTLVVKPGQKEGDKFEVLATNRLDDEIDGSPAVVGKQLFLRGAKNVYCIEGK